MSDPAAVQALLDQIRSSSAWQELSATSVSSQHSEPSPTPATESTKESTLNLPSTSSVSSLLSQLRSGSGAQETSYGPRVNDHLHQDLIAPTQPTLSTSQDHRSASVKDLRVLSLEESMPILLQLAHEPSFVQEMKKLKRDQDALERQLWEERRSVHRKYEDKLKTAQTKASIIGGSISKHEAEMLADAHKKELHKFDNERALPAWDSLMSQQQLKLQRLQVPAMHVTSDSSERELQQRVLQVLTSIIRPSIS